MTFKTREEKRAFRMGLAVGRKKSNCNGGKKQKSKPVSKSKTPFFPDDFDYNDKGYIKGGYTCDGFFEPD